MCSANKQELCSVAGFTNEDPKKVAGAIPWGRASGPAGLAPEALQGRGRSCKAFCAGSARVRSVSFSQHRRYFSRPRRCHAHVFGIVCVRCVPGGVAVRRAPEPRPVRGDRGGLSDLSIRSLVFPPRDGERGVRNSHRAGRELRVPL
jgi:hypothetical protein